MLKNSASGDRVCLPQFLLPALRPDPPCPQPSRGPSPPTPTTPTSNCHQKGRDARLRRLRTFENFRNWEAVSCVSRNQLFSRFGLLLEDGTRWPGVASLSIHSQLSSEHPHYELKQVTVHFVYQMNHTQIAVIIIRFDSCHCYKRF